ncbi:MAG: hypothetical protein DCC68_08740 [Planctomycetota bacterium]|nr:MAG: hypothetical protein DCC68_08740 [Planctomycetota bacterium]
MEDRKMSFALRTVACCATIVAALWPAKAIGDEAALKRTAPDECIAWFSWAGLDALAKDGAKTNRTEQLLADEEVRAFLDSIAKNLDGAIDVGDDDDTKHFAQLFRVLSKRPAVAYLSRIAQVKREAPPKAPEPPTTPPQAAVLQTNKAWIGDDGLERVGIDFEVQATAGDVPPAPAASSSIAPAVAPQLEVRVGPGGPPRIGRVRTVEKNGEKRREVELVWPHATEWREFEVDVPINDDGSWGKGSDRPVAREELETVASNITPTTARFGRSRKVTVNGKEQNEVEVISPHGREWVRVDFDHELQTDSPTNQDEPLLPAAHMTEVDSLKSKLYGGFQVGQASPNYTPDPSFSGPPGPVFPPSPYAPPVPAIAAQICTDCSSCTSCEASTTVSVMHGAVVVDLGEHLAEAKTLYDKLTAEGSELPKQTIAEVEFAKLAWDQPMYLAFHEAYLIVAFDEASAEQCASGLAGKREVPKWLADAEANLPVERPAARLHVNIDGITKLVDEPFEEPSQEFVKLLGLDQVSAISFVAGLDDRGTAIKTLLTARTNGPEISRRTPRRPRDRQQEVPVVFDFFSGFLTPDDLSPIPRDATMAAAGKIDVKKILGLGLKLAKLEDDEAESAWEEAKKYLAERLFVDLSKDIVEALGSTWTLHYSSSEGGLMATTFTFTVRDEARLKTALEKLALVANAENAYVRKFTYRGQDVYYWQGGDDGGSAAWCIRDGRLVASLLPQTIKAHIARGPLKETLADVPDVRKLLPVGEKPTSGPLVLSYTDTRGILQWCYQYGSFLLPTIGQQLAQADEVTLALHDFPSLAVIEQYFAPSITTVSRTDAGLLIDSRQTVPMMSGMLFTLVAARGVESTMGDPLGLADVADLASSVVDLPTDIAVAAGGIGGSSISPYWHNDDVQYFPATPDALPVVPLPPNTASPGVGGPGPVAPPAYAPPGTPVPYAPSVPGQPYIPPPATAPTFPPAYYPAPVPPMPRAPVAIPAPPNVPLSVPAGLAPHVKPQPATPTPPAPLPPPAVLRNVPAGKLWQGAPAAVAPGTTAPAAYAAPLSPPPSTAASPATYSGPGPSVIGPPRDGPNADGALDVPHGVGDRYPNPFANKLAEAPGSADAAPREKPKATAQPSDKAKPVKGVPSGRPSRKLFRRRADAPTNRTIETMDLLSVELIRGVPKPPKVIQPGDRLQVLVEGTDYSPLSGVFQICPEGTLGGLDALRVGGLSLEKARAAVEDYLRTPTNDPRVSISLIEFAGQAQISGHHSLGPGGYLQFGPRGVKVVGLTLDEAKVEIEKLLGERFESPEVRLSFPTDAVTEQDAKSVAARLVENPKPSNPAVWAKNFRLQPNDVLSLETVCVQPQDSYKLAPNDQVSTWIEKTKDGHTYWASGEVLDDGTYEIGGDFGIVKIAGLTVSEAREVVRKQVRTTSPNARTSFDLDLSLIENNLVKGYCIGGDGQIQLGRYGNVDVVDCPLAEARTRIEARLKEHFGDAEVQLDARPSGKIGDSGVRVGFSKWGF